MTDTREYLSDMLGDRASEVFDKVEPGSHDSEPFESQDLMGREEEGTEIDAAEEQAENELSADPEITVQDSDTQSDIEELVVTGPKGRRKIKLDYSDKDSIKKYVQLAHGARKWQAERDQAKTELKTLSSERDELRKDWNTLENLYQEGGIKALAERLSPGQWEEIVDQAISERQQWNDMDPSERAAIEFDRYKEAQTKRERDLEAKYKQQLEQLENVKLETATKDVVAKASGALGKYGFDGRLGNPDLEYELNDRIWSKALQTLEQLPEDVEITQAMIDREFKTQALRQKKLFSLQTAERTKKAVSKAKEKSLSKAQAIARGPKATSSTVDKFRKEVKGGNWADALHTFVNGKLK